MEGRRTTDWLTWGVVKHHRTIGTTLNALARFGFSIKRIEEFCPTKQQISDRPNGRPMLAKLAGSLAYHARTGQS